MFDNLYYVQWIFRTELGLVAENNPRDWAGKPRPYKPSNAIVGAGFPRPFLGRNKYAPTGIAIMRLIVRCRR